MAVANPARTQRFNSNNFILTHIANGAAAPSIIDENGAGWISGTHFVYVSLIDRSRRKFPKRVHVVAAVEVLGTNEKLVRFHVALNPIRPGAIRWNV